MDWEKLQQYLEAFKKKNGMYPDLSRLFNLMQPQSRSYTDIQTGDWGNRHWMDEKFDKIQDPYQIGDYRGTGKLTEDTNLLYGRLNDLYRSSPDTSREVNKRFLDRDTSEGQSYFRSKHINM